METLFDLPAHPLFVHVPVVLVPLVAAATVVLAARPAWRHRYGVALLASSFVATVGTVLAAKSGEEFEEALGNRVAGVIDDHKSLGETTRLLVVLWFVAVVATVALDVAARRRAPTPPADSPSDAAGGEAPSTTMATGAWALSGLAAVLGVLGTIWMVRTGHEGARIVWDGVIPTG